MALRRVATALLVAGLITAQTAQAQDKASAIAKLTDAISKVATQDVLTQQELDSLLPGS